jgi:sensor histidine kinase YesM
MPVFNKINLWLDKYILPWPVRFLTHRFVILATMALLIPLLVFAGQTVLVLSINSYLNTMSVAVSSIVLLYATLTEIQQKRIAEMQEQRAQEDHTHVTQMHTMMLETLANQQEEIEELKQMLAAVQGQAYARKPRPQVADLRDLHPRGDARFEAADTKKRVGGIRG